MTIVEKLWALILSFDVENLRKVHVENSLINEIMQDQNLHLIFTYYKRHKSDPIDPSRRGHEGVFSVSRRGC